MSDAEVYVRPGDPNSTHDISVSGGGQKFGVRLRDQFEGMQQIPSTQQTKVVDQAGTRFGDGDPSNAHIEQRDWSGGRGLKYLVDDKSRFFDSQNMITWVTGKVLPSYQFQIALGDHRDADQSQPGNVSWQGLLGSKRYIAINFDASASYNAEEILLWIRRIGNPGTLTAALYSDSAGAPNTLLQSATVDTDTITDFISVLHRFDIATQALTISTTYWVVVYGDTNDNINNRWEIGVNVATDDSYYSSAGSSWTANAGFSLYYRVVDDATAIKHHFFTVGKLLHAVDQPGSGASSLYKWDETNDDWDSVSVSGDALSNPVKSVAVSNDIAHMARGATETIWTYDYSGPTGQDDLTAGNNADVLLAGYYSGNGDDQDPGPVIWRAENDNFLISWSYTKPFNTDLAFEDDIQLEKGFDVLSMAEFNGFVQVRTESNIWSVVDEQPERLTIGIDHVWETEDFLPMLAQDEFLYFAWSHSVERWYQGQINDIGPWRDEGLPTDRKGFCSAMASGIGGTFFAFNAGADGYSHILFWNNRGMHEVFRAWDKGLQIYNIAWQPVAGAKPRLWISIGADLVYLELPQDAINPLHDATVNYMHEGVLISSIIDMGRLGLKKAFFNDTATTENLTAGIEIALDYQVDDDVGTDDWLSAGKFLESEEDVVAIDEGNRRKMRLRLRFRSNNADVPPVLNALIVEGFGRVPFKRQWNLDLTTGDYQVTWVGGRDHDPNKFLDFLMDAAMNAVLFRIRSVWEPQDDLWVTIAPTSVFPEFVNRFSGEWQGDLTVTFREA
jgi:hypothetical protein